MHLRVHCNAELEASCRALQQQVSHLQADQTEVGGLVSDFQAEQAAHAALQAEHKALQVRPGCWQRPAPGYALLLLLHAACCVLCARLTCWPCCWQAELAAAQQSSSSTQQLESQLAQQQAMVATLQVRCACWWQCRSSSKNVGSAAHSVLC